MATEVRDNAERSRYELFLDGDLIGVADYELRGDTAVIPHTEIAPARRGQGYGAVLVRGVLDDIRARGRSVVPQCWYVADFIDTNPAYRDLVPA